jgi:tetratricopeptide (TPR) repeat protein
VSGYRVARLEEIEETTDGREPWRAVRHHLGITAFGVNTWTGREAGERLINEHDEDEPGGNEELYLVLHGRARFELDGETVDAPTGTFVFAKPGVKRTAFAEEPGTTLVAIGGVAGQAYEVTGWHFWAPFNSAYQEGRYDEVADGLAPIVDANPEYADLAYNLACVESLAGRKEDALEHLRRSIERSESSRELARTDSDLDAIRAEPAFEELVGD